ncbi:hypothetical protein PLEOSDRAFT_156356 [Pleurotus ostreatus PC15]|uniref:Uncharacterized protein n=1 Tax=Pleurotus ostreatus (strain PC15) TaxID=1137138 RepID=A0A067NKZ9_PLEO1|nr:hypothetical protein PLEOSDRAFT_156356 [Pleurotus ostreatus PC15]
MSDEKDTALNTPPPLMKQWHIIELPSGGTPDTARFPEETLYTEQDDVLMECDEGDQEALTSFQYADRGESSDGNFSPLASPGLSGLPDVSSQLSSIFPDESPAASQEVDSANFLGFLPTPSKSGTDSHGTDIQGTESNASLFARDSCGADDVMSH